MDEYFLQFLWKFQKFESQPLILSDGQKLTVFKPGHQNMDSGPDFHQASIKIGELTWSGSVEIHYKASDWERHGHGTDQSYDNVILHAVWIKDRDIMLNGQPIPTLQMSDYVSANLENEYRKYINQPTTIRCSSSLNEVPEIQVSAMLDRALASRLEQKSLTVLKILSQCNGNWEETTYRTLARNFGFKTNAEPFEKLAESLPYSIVRKHHQNPTQTFALVFGMAGFLETIEDEYQQQLAEEFDYLSKKYELEPVLQRHHWKHAKMRPANFPSVRLAQMAAFLCHNDQIFATLIRSTQMKQVEKMVRKELPEYWKTHFDFGKPSKKDQQIGKTSLENIVINSLAPVLGAYSKYLDELSYMDTAQKLLEQLPAENNNILRQWESIGISPSNAGESQALIHQYKDYCNKKRCLRCNIGVSILKPAQ